MPNDSNNAWSSRMNDPLGTYGGAAAACAQGCRDGESPSNGPPRRSWSNGYLSLHGWDPRSPWIGLSVSAQYCPLPWESVMIWEECTPIGTWYAASSPAPWLVVRLPRL